jgi:hypothetical protein
MDAKLRSMAEHAIAKETPLKGYKLGVLDAALRPDSNEIVVILLDGRKMVYPIDMKANIPAAKMINHQSIPAPTAKSGGTRSQKEK